MMYFRQNINTNVSLMMVSKGRTMQIVERVRCLKWMALVKYSLAERT
jgi:hypothetical protein